MSSKSVLCDRVGCGPPLKRRYIPQLIGCSGIPVAAFLLIVVPAASATPLQDSRATVAGFVAQIQKADYEGDRAVLRFLFDRPDDIAYRLAAVGFASSPE
jgi:hypothetical protein